MVWIELPLVWMVTLLFSFNRDCGVISILHCIMIRLIQIRECWLVSTHVIATACIQIPHILVGFLLCMTHHQKRYFLSLKVRLSTIFVSFATSFSLIFLVWLLRALLLRASCSSWSCLISFCLWTRKEIFSSLREFSSRSLDSSIEQTTQLIVINDQNILLVLVNLHLIDNCHCLILEKKSSIDSPNFMCKAANSSQSAWSCTHFDLWYFLLTESRICLEVSLQRIVFKIDLSIAWRYPSTSMLLIQLSTSLSQRHHQVVLLLQKRWLSNTLWTWEYSPSKGGMVGCTNGSEAIYYSWAWKACKMGEGWMTVQTLHHAFANFLFK